MDTSQSRTVTHNRRDVVARFVDDDPKAAEMLLWLFTQTDQSTPAGSAARDDIMRELYSLTEHSRNGLKTFLNGMVASFVALVAFAIYFTI